MQIPGDHARQSEEAERVLSECWTLCNTLAFLNFNRGDVHEQPWRSCWKLCQTLYDTPQVSRTLDICQEFCQALFEVQIRDNEGDSVLRMSFGLINHFYNTIVAHGNPLEAIQGRTLDFYIILCHHLMKQRMHLRDDSLLQACWGLAELLFSMRQNKDRKPTAILLNSAFLACWELCNLFREVTFAQVSQHLGTPTTIIEDTDEEDEEEHVGVSFLLG
jgi:hypothetical protein